jgi:hypothetical protein
MGSNSCKSSLYCCPDKQGRLIPMATINADFVPDDEPGYNKEFPLNKKFTVSYDEVVYYLTCDYLIFTI